MPRKQLLLFDIDGAVLRILPPLASRPSQGRINGKNALGGHNGSIRGALPLVQIPAREQIVLGVHHLRHALDKAEAVAHRGYGRRGVFLSASSRGTPVSS